MNGSHQKSGRPKSRQSIAHISSQSNTTTDIGALKRSIDTQEKSKRSRGKSLGPGGFEALTETNANIFKIPPSYQPRSILKTSVPLTPPKVIPSFDELRQKSNVKAKSPAKAAPEDLLIDFSTPGPSREVAVIGNIPANDDVFDPFSPVRSKTSTTQQLQNGNGEDSARGVEEEEQKRQAEKERRAARRKSLANRRVSFAPEATLHTWSVMELLEDSTTSSAANSTRRQSSMMAAQSPAPQVTASEDVLSIEGQATPVDRPLHDPIHQELPSQRELHQRKRRRTSDSAHSSDDETFSSAGDEAESSPVRMEDSIDSESDTDGDTAMSLDEATANSVRSSGSSSTQTSLDERLRQAADLAGTRGIHYDENGSENDGEETMEIADGTVTHAFKPYAQKDSKARNSATADDKENFNPFQSHRSATNDDENLRNNDTTNGFTMEMTRAVGGIISNTNVKEADESPTRRGSSLPRHLSTGGEISIDEESMDLTVAKGYILEHDDDTQHEHDDDLSYNDDMTMEMTNAMGSIYNRLTHDRSLSHTVDQTEAMDMTIAAGGILPPIEEQTEPQTELMDDMTGAMDMTRAVGKILGNTTESSPTEKPVTDARGLHATPGPRINGDHAEGIPSLSLTNRQMTTVTSETGSPTLRPRLSARRKTIEKRSTTPRSTPKIDEMQSQEQSTPSKQLTPAPQKSVSPRRTPVLTGVTHRSASPKKLFGKEINTRASPATRKSPQRQKDLLFSKDETTGLHTPRVVLHAPKPHQHLHGRRKGVEISDKDLGSPRVSELLSRRSSIGDIAPNFELALDQTRTIHIEDPQEIERQVDLERAEEYRRESGRVVMEQEADEQEIENTTQNLKDMIESMTPKKEQPKKYKNRKSLAIGSAKGLLGKRPAELDFDDVDDDNTSMSKRLRTVSREASPVKKVHLPRPPTKEETTGRLSRSEALRLSTVEPSVSTPVLSQSPISKAKSPERTGHFKRLSPEKASSFESRLDNVMDATDISTTHPDLADGARQEEQISLQQFLNMTNIHFIELSTTKRRYTKALPSTEAAADDNTDGSTRATFVAATTTLPLLDLYQHATRELKSYISSGRQIIRTIEDETFTEQPPVFRKYVDASPEAKVLMDNQFRNSKTNARLQSKESWYFWRSQLVEGLRNGLQHILEEAKHDNEVLSGQQHTLNQTLPHLASQKTQLKQQVKDLRQRVLEFERFDHEALKTKRRELLVADQELAENSGIINQLREQMQEKDELLSQATELRQEMSDQIKEVVRVQEKHTQWPSKAVTDIKERVEKLEQESGWQLLTAEESGDETNDLGTALTLRYEKELTLFFHPAAFRPEGKSVRRRSGRNSRSVSGPSAPISLTYSSDENDEQGSSELSTEYRFFLQLLQSQLQGYAMLPKNSVTCQQVLKTISNGWSLAKRIAGEISQLNTVGIVRVHIQNDEQLACTLTLMQPGRSRIDVTFSLTVHSLNDGEFSATTNVTATPMYGSATIVTDATKLRKVQHALSKEVGSRNLGEGSWRQAVRGFQEWLQIQTTVDKQSSFSGSISNQNMESALVTDVNTKQEAKITISIAEPRRAVTQSPRGTDKTVSTTPKVPPRSPLAPRTTNRILKKTIPVPKKPVIFSQSQNAASDLNTTRNREPALQKENLVPLSSETKVVQEANFLAVDDVFGAAKPAITPAEQEAMMHTPVKKRVGALRRSPI